MGPLLKKMVSYSASFEDVILQRGLQDVSFGCYIDVGASMPLGDSNTAAFYGKGWRGICIEPLKTINEEWAQCRPEDFLINAVAGAQPGETTLYFYEATTQISTCSVETMEHWKKFNQPPDKEMVVPVITLNQVVEQFIGDRTIHLLSIDAEGSEKQVLQGFDLKKYCPWVIIIEATVPGTHTPAYHAWENDVLEAGYTMVYDDSVNRFYLSNKKPELRQHFLAPPNVWDEFIPIRQQVAQQKCEELLQANELIKTENEMLRKMLDDKISLPANFWDYVPNADDLARQQQIVQLQETNQSLSRQLLALQQSLALKEFLNK